MSVSRELCFRFVTVAQNSVALEGRSATQSSGSVELPIGARRSSAIVCRAALRITR